MKHNRPGFLRKLLVTRSWGRLWGAASVDDDSFQIRPSEYRKTLFFIGGVFFLSLSQILPVRAQQTSGAGGGRLTLHVGLPNKMGDKLPLLASGKLEGAPYDVSWSEFSATPALLQALRTGDIDIGGNGGSTAIILSESLTPGSVKIIGIGKYVGKNADNAGGALIVARDSPIRSFADLRNARISVMRGTGMEYMLARTLQKNGIPLSQANLLPLPNAAALAALLTGRVDVWGAWEPQASIILQRRDVRLLGWLGGHDEQYAIQYASARSLQNPEKRAAIKDFLQRLAAASVWSEAHRTEWAEKGSDLLRSDRNIMLQVADHTAIEYGLSHVEMEAANASFQREAAFWKQAGKITSLPDMRNIIDNSFNDDMTAATLAEKRSIAARQEAR